MAGPTLRRSLQAFFIALLLATGYAGLQYRTWVSENAAALREGSEVVSTSVGPIEFARSGESGSTVLLVHGTPGGYDQTIALGRAFNEAGYRVLAVSRPGYLRTPLSVGRTPAQQADAYAALLDALDLERVGVVGISGGGPSSLEFAIRHATRCWALVEFMGVSRAPEKGEMTPARQLAGRVQSRLLASNVVGWLLSLGVSASPEALVGSLVPDQENARRILAKADSRAAFVALAESVLRLPELRNSGTENDMKHILELDPLDLAAIRVPTLVLHGTADINVPFAMAELVADEVVGAELVSFAGADHFMGLSHTDEVFAALFGFLDRHGNDPRLTVGSS